MEELVLIAAASAEVTGAIGLAQRDPDAAHALHTRALALAPLDARIEADPPALTIPSLLRFPDPALPLDGPADGYWTALACCALAVSRDSVRCEGVGSLHDLDTLIDAAGVGHGVDLVAASRHPRLPFGAGDDVDVRVIPAAVATTFARAWLDSAPGAEHGAITRFLRRFLDLGPDADRPPPDLWAVVPAVVAAQEGPVAPWPLTPLPTPRAGADLLSLAGPLAQAVPTAELAASKAELQQRFAATEGLWARGAWRLEWCFSDGLARATSHGLQGPPQDVYGHLSPQWGARFDAALRAAGFPVPPHGLDTEGTLTLGATSVPISSEGAGGAWADVVDLLDGALATLAPEAAEHRPEPDWVLPL